jgi:hypothetical protein
MYAKTWLGMDFARCFTYIARRSGGFLQLIHQWSYPGPARMRHEQPRNWERGFFKLFQLTAQPLTVLIQLLQRFITIDEITIRGFTKLHLLNTLMIQLLIFIFKYLIGILFLVDNILQISL